MLFIDKIMHQKTQFHKFRDNLSAIVRFDHLKFRRFLLIFGFSEFLLFFGTGFQNFNEIQIFPEFFWNSVTLARLNPVERSTEINKTKQFISCSSTHGQTLNYSTYFACWTLEKHKLWRIHPTQGFFDHPVNSTTMYLPPPRPSRVNQIDFLPP